jgi:tetratricopeptide (TPR) repeat protein
MSGAFLVALAIGLPVLLFVAWPLFRPRDGRPGFLPLPPDRREQLLEEKAGVYRTLRELAFEREAGHLSAGDYAALRDRYEARAAVILAALDTAATVAPAARPGRAATHVPWTRRPATLALAGAGLLGLGIALGLGIERSTGPDLAGGADPPGPAAGLGGESAVDRARGPDGAPRRPVPPEVLGGMLHAARSSLMAGRYEEAIAAYRAVLERDARNVDALTHLGLIVAIGNHPDTALETIDRALAIDPNYAPALLYRGQILFELKRDYAGATRAWEKFLVVVPDGEEHERVRALVREARARARPG